jgi:hypothetical protein
LSDVRPECEFYQYLARFHAPGKVKKITAPPRLTGAAQVLEIRHVKHVTDETGMAVPMEELCVVICIPSISCYEQSDSVQWANCGLECRMPSCWPLI